MDEEYDDYDEYNDAADDWEAEAAEEEAREKEMLEQKALMEELKLQKRIKAPARGKKEEVEEEEMLPSDITRALNDMIEKASSAAEMIYLNKDSSNDGKTCAIIADMPINTPEEATMLGEAIANRVLEYSTSSHFNALVEAIFKDLQNEFKTPASINAEVGQLRVASEEAKRRAKKAKKTKGGHHNDDTAANENVEGITTHDAVGFHKVEDKTFTGGVHDDDYDFI
ncbi:uncharacterized protein TM35_000111300 [Trypanosoma theileri]|uniref:Uncharacterized protein n=1 Tax=Trypanosoma theileri TaxID=67003 RepID=A0A1X0NY21_9TRYP|nr:uncharacterized protein TM35_000111300 [Trypanosoma theileri]ORC89596.1 hypothetical protein TM35_000111300 [Trypanosoma theileri]